MLTNYLKIAFKVLARRKVYTAINLFGIAFTLTILMVVVALVDHVLAPAPPEVDLDRIVSIERASLTGPRGSRYSNPGYALLDRYARDLPGLERLSITTTDDPVVTWIDGHRVQSRMRRTDAAFWEVMRFRFLEGGPFTEADAKTGTAVAVVNASTRERLFGDGPALGRTARFGPQAFRIVGVVEDVSFLRRLSHADVWVPIATLPDTGYRDELTGGFVGILLAESPASIGGLRAELARRLEAAELPDPRAYDRVRALAAPLFETIARDLFDVGIDEAAPIARLRFVLAGFVLAFMALPALNLVNLNVSRILERVSEIGVRKSFGASSASLGGQFLVENIVLCTMGGLLGLVAAAAVLHAVRLSQVIPYATLSLNPRVFLWAMLLSMVFGVLSGAYPAWKMSRLAPVEALGGRA